MYLAAAGVGTLGIVEFDTVDESNLQRQIIHGQSDVGRSKAESARDSIKEINPLIDVRLHEVRLDSENVMEIFADYDLIVDGTDNFATRYLVNDACVLLDKPYVWGSIYRFDGQASVFWDEHGPNYRDLYPVPPPPGMVPQLRRGRRARRALRDRSARSRPPRRSSCITGIGEPLLGRLMVYDALEMTFRTIKVRKDPEGRADHRAHRLRGLLRRRLGRGPGGGGRLDDHRRRAQGHDGRRQGLRADRRPRAGRVRDRVDPGRDADPQGRDPVRPGAVAAAEDKPIVLHCKTGVRSAEALAAVKAAGFKDAVHVQGGVTAWATRIDKALPTY